VDLSANASGVLSDGTNNRLRSTPSAYLLDPRKRAFGLVAGMTTKLNFFFSSGFDMNRFTNSKLAKAPKVSFPWIPPVIKILGARAFEAVLISRRRSSKSATFPYLISLTSFEFSKENFLMAV